MLPFQCMSDNSVLVENQQVICKSCRKPIIRPLLVDVKRKRPELRQKTLLNMQGPRRCSACSAQRLKERRQGYEAKRPDEQRIFYSARARAKRDGILFTIQRSDIVISKFCPLLGIPLVRGHGSCSDNSPSLDRKIPALGYTPNNIWVISHKANTMKSNASLQEMEELVRNWRRMLF